MAKKYEYVDCHKVADGTTSCTRVSRKPSSKDSAKFTKRK